MKKNTYLPILFLLVLSFSSCEVIGGIFKAGVWTGIVAVVLVVALIIWLISRATKK
ncbi:phosphatidate cytidylyltransferase [Pseudoflavitalea rhizosphaerae]|uniref:phosphatidate cytidylyltransferase n=1 Tax=Pseudoflavitalea rhizosphaerae TaxID=1884793 RepID=UPI000F8CB5AB|nr:phosphatidate cytidylyltransferase [Pseudoflavitalea rhizosphaerae]